MKTRSLIIRAAGAAAILIGVFGGQNWAGAQTVSPATSTVQTQPAETPAKAPALSYGAFQAVDMYQRDIRTETIVGYINNSSAAYQLSADAILYMKSLGIPVEIVNAMLQRDIQLRAQENPPAIAQEAVTPVATNWDVIAPAPPPMYGTAPDAETSVVPDYSSAPDDSSDYDQYWPPIVIGGGWGWAHRWDHGHDHGDHGRGEIGRGSHGGHGSGFHGVSGGGFHGGGFGGGGYHAGFGGGGHGGGGHR